jgi:hypothetical protein
MIFLLLIFIVVILQINSTSPSAPLPSRPVQPSAYQSAHVNPHSRQSRDYRFSESPLDSKQGWWGADVNFPLSSTKDLSIPSYDDSGNYNSVVNPITGQRADIVPASVSTTGSETNIDINTKNMVPYMVSYLIPPQKNKEHSDNPYWASLTIPPTNQNNSNNAPPRLVTAPDNNCGNSRLSTYEDASGNYVENNGFMDYNFDAYSPF